MAQEIRGTVKRASNGALVAEVWSGEYVQIGQEVTVDGLISTVIDLGRKFKRGGAGFQYLYLAEPTTVTEESDDVVAAEGLSEDAYQRARRFQVEDDGYDDEAIIASSEETASEAARAEQRRAAFRKWIEQAPVIRLHTTLPRRELAPCEPAPSRSREDVWLRRNSWPLGPTYYRKVDGGWEEIGEFSFKEGRNG